MAITTDAQRYLIVWVDSDDQRGLDEGSDFDAALETVDLRPDEAQ